MKLKLAAFFFIFSNMVHITAQDVVVQQIAQTQPVFSAHKAQLVVSLDAIIHTAAALLYDINHDHVAVEKLHRQLMRVLRRHLVFVTDAFGDENGQILSQLKMYTLTKQAYPDIAYNCRLLIQFASCCKLQLHSMQNLLVNPNEIYRQKAIDDAQDVVGSLAFQSWYRAQKIKKNLQEHQLLLAGMVAAAALVTTWSTGLVEKLVPYVTQLLETVTGQKEEQEITQDKPHNETVTVAAGVPPQKPDVVIVIIEKKEDASSDNAQDAKPSELVETEPKNQDAVPAISEDNALQDCAEKLLVQDTQDAQPKIEELQEIIHDLSQKEPELKIEIPEQNSTFQLLEIAQSKVERDPAPEEIEQTVQTLQGLIVPVENNKEQLNHDHHELLPMIR